MCVNTEKSELQKKLDEATRQLSGLASGKDQDLAASQARMVEIMTSSSSKDEEIARLNREIARLKQRIEELEKLLAAQSALPSNGVPAIKVILLAKHYINA